MKTKVKELLQRTIFPVTYWLGSKRKIDEGSVYFTDSHNSVCPESMIELRNYFKNNHIDIEEKYSDFSKLGLFKSFVVSVMEVWRVSTKKVIILCDNYHAMDSFVSREGQYIVQLWHGSGAYKKFGYDVTDKEPTKSNKLFRYDKVYTSSEFSSKMFSTAMRLPLKKFKSIGVSRTDKFFNEKWISDKRNDIYNDYPHLKGKKVVVWAPTFRDLHDTDELHEGEKEINRLIDDFPDYIFIKKMHPHISKDTTYDKYSSTDLMTIADILITDYSSLIFDWMIIGNRTILFMPDYEKYTEVNGFYYDPKKFPFSKAYDYEDLKKEFSDIYVEKNIDEKKEFQETMIRSCDGYSTERIFRDIIDIIKR